MPRQLCIAQVDSERGFSGGEVQVFLLIEGLRRLGHRSVLFCAPGSRSAEAARKRGFEYFTVRMRNDLDLPAVFALRRGFLRCGADLVHLHTGRANWLGGLAARAAGLPAITTRRMDRTVKRNWRTRLIYEYFTQRAAAISPAVVECLVGGGVPPERIQLVSEAVDPSRSNPTAGRESVRGVLGAKPQDVVLLTLAALIRRKGIDLLLDALAQLGARHLHPLLWIAGDGPERSTLTAQSNRLGLDPQVRFLGSRDDTADLLAACDVFVLPSRREGLGVAALEAMAAGRAVVCSAVGGLGFSVVDGQTGLLFPAEDANALAQALTRVVEDGELRARLGSAGPGRIAERFLAQQMVEAYAEIYRNVMQEWKTRRTAPSKYA